MAKMKCVVVTPEKTVVDREATFLAVPLYDGELGVAPGHAPLIGRMGFGELRITEGDSTESLFVEGGFVEVLNNVVTVLTNRALPVDSLDVETAQEQLEAARNKPAASPELMDLRDRAIAQARAQKRVAERFAR